MLKLVLAALTGLPNVYAAWRGRGAAVVSETLNSNALNLLIGIAIPAAVFGLGRGSRASALEIAWLHCPVFDICRRASLRPCSEQALAERKKTLKKTQFGLWAVTALFAAGLCAPLSVCADGGSVQKRKNNYRNLGIGAAVLGGVGLLKGNKTLGVLGAAGAAYSASRYEKARHRQSQTTHRRDVHHHRQVGNFTRNGRKYYVYHSHEYYKDLSDGSRHYVR